MKDFLRFGNHNAMVLIGKIGTDIIDGNEASSEDIAELRTTLTNGMTDMPVIERETILVDIWQLLYNATVREGDSSNAERFEAAITAIFADFPEAPLTEEVEEYCDLVKTFRKDYSQSDILAEAIDRAENIRGDVLRYLAQRSTLNTIMMLGQWGRFKEETRRLVAALSEVSDEVRAEGDNISADRVFVTYERKGA